MNKRQVSIETEIANIKQGLLELGHMHPGSLSQQQRSGVGIYHQLSYSHAGKGHTKYVQPEDVSEVRREIELATLRRDQRKSTRRDAGNKQQHTR